MTTAPTCTSVNFPDDPMKWKGWRNYDAANPYERLCLDPTENPGDEQIQQHCAALLQWWNRKLRLKNQPSNPVTQLLGRGIDDAARCLVEARMRLLDAAQRRQIDDQLAAQAQQEALADFGRYVSFSLARRVLTADAEANLREFGERNGLTPEQTRACIEEELKRHDAQRVAAAAATATAPASTTSASPEAEEEFLRILRLSHLNLADATARVRGIFATIAESLGISLERAEHLLDDYLESTELQPGASPLRDRSVATQPAPAKRVSVVPATAPRVHRAATPKAQGAAPHGAQFVNATGAPMLSVPGGEFMMGSREADAAPNEGPLTPVTVSQFYMARHPVTNAQYEQFDPSHAQKRMSGAGDDHPVVYVTSFEALRYCQWLAQKDGKTYRLPTEAEWEYAARGTDGRKYPWGNHERRNDLANFADASTAFAWRDALINDGYPETSPVGAFPSGASFFGIEDMAGNVWEWCLDFYQPLPGTPKRNPRGLASGPARVYRGGSWKSRFSNLRASARSSNAPNFAANDVGFRVVCECAGEP
jgi:formylglycine-generating enzyme